MNRDTLIKGLVFVTGAAIGSAVTWKLVKTKYEKIAQEEIESVREVYSQRSVKEKTEEAADEVEVTEEPEDYINESIEQAKEISKKYGYVRESEREEEEEKTDMSKPRVISPEEFGEEGYPCISLTYYDDGVVTNEHGKIVTNTDELIGKDFADHFGEYEDDSVFIRNDDMEIDYEILKDLRAYSEIE